MEADHMMPISMFVASITSTVVRLRYIYTVTSANFMRDGKAAR